MRISVDRLIATNPYAHKNGSQSGMRPNKVFLSNVSTPVLMKRYSEISIITNPNPSEATRNLEVLSVVLAPRVHTQNKSRPKVV